MAKYNIGDVVRYSNKNEQLDVFGEIIAIMRDTWAGSTSVAIEPLDEKFSHHRAHRTTIYFNPAIYSIDRNKFVDNPSNTLRSRNRIIWAPMRSKNLVPGYPPKDYDPSQNGDTDEDI